MTNEESNNGKRRKITTFVLFVVGIFLLITFIIAIASYSFPDFFEPEFKQEVAGDATMQTLIVMTDELLEEWTPNDVAWPTVLLDNPQNFQLGQLEVLRYTSRVLRDNLTRMRTTDKIDVDADSAYTNFANDPLRWMLPSAEAKFKTSLKHLQSFQTRLQSKKANFFPRGDNLIELLSEYNSLLGGVCTRLSTLPGDFSEMLSEETAGDVYTSGEKKVNLKVGWMEIDDHFYYAQGVAFCLHQMLFAIKYDFKEIIELKKASELLENIILVLQHTQWEPKYMVMNCSPGSWIPCQNDPMMLNSRLQDARQKIRSLINMIEM